ncbi:hypothetical protein Hanom_Chr12g01124971 [Helianthus anomalus]
MRHYRPVDPIHLVNPKVTAIAIQPPTRILKQDFTTGVLPKRAPIHPKTTSATLTVATTTPSLTVWSTINAAASKGTMAPNINAMADAAAA